MRYSREIDNDMLAAFVDGQLDTRNCERVIQAMDTDDAVRERIDRLRRAKDLMKLGFADARPPAPGPEKYHTHRVWPYRLNVAASVLILIGLFSFGLFGYMAGKQQSGDSASALATTVKNRPHHVIVHIEQPDVKQFDAVLTYADSFLNRHQDEGGQIAIVAHASGLDLLRAGVSPYEKRIYAMIRKYDNVQFIACANAIQNLRRKGIEPLFHGSIDTGKPALDQIVARVQEGWTYVKASSLI